MPSHTYKAPNRTEEFRRAAETIGGKIASIDGVVGVLATGGVARGYCDDVSDLDLVVFTEEERTDEIASYIAIGMLMHKDICLDTPVESYRTAVEAEVPSEYWSQVVRWDREHAIVVADTDGRIGDLLANKIVFPESERKRLLEQYRVLVEEYLLYNVDMWSRRGTLANVADTIITGTAYLICWLYAKNRKFQPYLPKWLFYYLENHLIPESQYLDALTRPYLEGISTHGKAMEIRNDLLEICRDCGVVFRFNSVEEVFEHCRNNWDALPERSKKYLAW
jgi:hypothetical protein